MATFNPIAQTIGPDHQTVNGQPVITVPQIAAAHNVTARSVLVHASLTMPLNTLEEPWAININTGEPVLDIPRWHTIPIDQTGKHALTKHLAFTNLGYALLCLNWHREPCCTNITHQMVRHTTTQQS